MRIPKGWHLTVVDGFEYYWTPSNVYGVQIINPLTSGLRLDEFMRNNPCPNIVTPEYVKKAVRWYYNPENKGIRDRFVRDPDNKSNGFIR